jgi:hypothetical protein
VFNLLVESSSQFGESENKNAGDGYPMKAIEKLVLRFLSSHTFSHGLGRIGTLLGNGRRPHLALGLKYRPLISTFTSSVNWRRRSFDR